MIRLAGIHTPSDDRLVWRRADRYRSCLGDGETRIRRSERCPRIIKTGEIYLENRIAGQAEGMGPSHCEACALEFFAEYFPDGEAA